MHGFTRTVGLLLLGGACTPPSKSLGAGQSDESSGTSQPSSESSAADDANGSTAATVDDGGDDCEVCCESVENPTAICGAAQTQEDCDAADVGDGHCFWVEWRPTTFDGIECVSGPPQFECRYQACSFEGCAGSFQCPDGGPGVVVRSGPEGSEIGLGNWCFVPDGAIGCEWAFEGNLLSDPAECVCACEGSNLCDAPFAAYLAELASASETEAMDCGALPRNATLAEWQAVHDCTLAAAAAGQTFIASWGPEEGDIVGPDVEIRYGYVGIQGESYELVHAHSDLTENGQDIVQQTCSALVATEDCTVAVKQPCITCVDGSMSTQVCSEA